MLPPMVEGHGGRGPVDYGPWDHFLRGRLATDRRWLAMRRRGFTNKRYVRTPFGWLRVTGAYGLKCGICGKQMGSGCKCDFEAPVIYRPTRTAAGGNPVGRVA
jgi:hypothetical protein